MSSLASSQPRVLVAQHDDALRDMLVAMLQLEGYATDKASSLEEACEKVDHELYDLILSDLFSPSPPRLEAAKRLLQQCHPTPVGILTGWHLNQDEVEQVGFSFALQKPFDMDMLLQYIADSLNPPFSLEKQQQANIIRHYLQALSDGDWEALRVLCTVDVGYYPLTKSAFTDEREIKGIESYLAYAQSVRRRLPNFQIEQVVIFHHPTGLIARYVFRWQSKGGPRQWMVGSVTCRFRGARISQIGDAVNTSLLCSLLEQDQQQAPE